MTDETKKCPYCAEEINIDAIKCKHCGEFLNSEKKSSSPTSSLSIEQTISPQNFNFAIIVAVLSILLSFVEVFNDIDDSSKISWKITMYSYAATVLLWYYFRKYLINFKVSKATLLVNWIIVLNVTIGLLTIIMKALPKNNSSEEWQNTDTLGLTMGVFAIVIMIVSIVVYIRTGIVLQKIKNDFVGLLKELGMAVAYLLPVVLLIDIVGTVMDNKAINIFGTALDNISTIIMIMIFYRAKKYVK